MIDSYSVHSSLVVGDRDLIAMAGVQRSPARLLVSHH